MPTLIPPIIDAISNNTYLKSDIVKKSLYPFSPQSSLTLAGPQKVVSGSINIDESQAIQLFHALQNNNEINTLEFELDFNFTPAIILELQNLLQNPAITTLKFNHLYPSAKAQANNLLELLTKTNKNLKLYFEAAFDKATMGQIAKLIDCNKVDELTLKFGKAEESNDLIALFKALKANTSLRTLTISMANVDKIIVELTKALADNHTLTTLALPTGMTETGFKQLCDQLKRDTALKYITMGFNSLENDEPLSSEIQYRQAITKAITNYGAECVTRCKSIIAFQCYINNRDLDCSMHSKYICYCMHHSNMTDADDKIEAILCNHRLNEIADAEAACKQLLEKPLEDIKLIENTCNQALTAIENAEAGKHYYLNLHNNVSNLKCLVLEIFCTIMDLDNASKFYKEHFLLKNCKNFNKAYHLLGHMLLAHAADYSDQVDIDDINLKSCAYLIRSACMDEHNSIVVKNLLERIVLKSFAQKNFKEIITQPRFIEEIWPRLVSKIDEEFLEQKVNIEEAPIEQVLDNVHVFCRYLCDKNKRSLLYAELWRSRAEYWRSERNNLSRILENVAHLLPQLGLFKETNPSIKAEQPVNNPSFNLSSSFGKC